MKAILAPSLFALGLLAAAPASAQALRLVLAAHPLTCGPEVSVSATLT